MGSLYVRPYLSRSKVKLTLDDLRKCEVYWHCKLENDLLIIDEDKPLYFRSKFGKTQLWDHLTIIFKHIHNKKARLTEYPEGGGEVRKEKLLPLLVTSGHIVAIDTKTNKKLTDKRFKEEYPDILEWIIPKYFIDENCIVWKVDSNFRKINDQEFLKEQVKYITYTCETKIIKLKKRIETEYIAENSDKNELLIYEKRLKEVKNEFNKFLA